MGRPRSELHAILVGIVGDSKRVYHQPPSGLRMEYPCITYFWDFTATKSADNRPFIKTKRYQITTMSRDPNWDAPDKVSDLPQSSFTRSFKSDDLNHVVHDVYF